MFSCVSDHITNDFNNSSFLWYSGLPVKPRCNL